MYSSPLVTTFFPSCGFLYLPPASPTARPTLCLSCMEPNSAHDKSCPHVFNWPTLRLVIRDPPPPFHRLLTSPSPQRNYRGYRTRRAMQGMRLDASTRWIEAIRESVFNRPLSSILVCSFAASSVPKCHSTQVTSASLKHEQQCLHDSPTELETDRRNRAQGWSR